MPDQPWESIEPSPADDGLPAAAGPVEDDVENYDEKIRRSLDPDEQMKAELPTDENVRLGALSQRERAAHEAADEANRAQKNRGLKKV